MGTEHAVNLGGIEGVDIVMVADAIDDAATVLASRVGAEATTDVAALIGDPRVDAIVIASTDETHAELALAALQSAKPTLCEKPLAVDLDDAVGVMAAEAATGRRLLQVGLMRVYDPIDVELKERVPSNGRVHHIRAVHRNRNDFHRSIDHAISQSMVHDIHTVRWLAEAEITSVVAGMVPRNGDGVRFVTAAARLDSGALASFEFDDFAFGYDVSVEVTGENGLARTPDPADTALHDDWFAWFSVAYRREAEAWVSSIGAGSAAGPSAWDGVAVQAVVQAIQRSVRSGREEAVFLPDCPSLYGRR